MAFEKRDGIQNTAQSDPTADEIVPDRMESGMKEENDHDRREVPNGVVISSE
uniref:Uncharacterized protein n=1 Tax=Rhizophora mucronata TaxID=61149 RepID=A0A2P2L9L9_RHIMU